jgi:hypothetical protein
VSRTGTNSVPVLPGYNVVISMHAAAPRKSIATDL